MCRLQCHQVTAFRITIHNREPTGLPVTGKCFYGGSTIKMQTMYQASRLLSASLRRTLVLHNLSRQHKFQKLRHSQSKILSCIAVHGTHCKTNTRNRCLSFEKQVIPIKTFSNSWQSSTKNSVSAMVMTMLLRGAQQNRRHQICNRCL